MDLSLTSNILQNSGVSVEASTTRPKRNLQQLHDDNDRWLNPSLEYANPSVRRPHDRLSHRSTRGGVYQPNDRIQQLAHVRQVGEDEKTLRCSKCSHTITSSWFFVGRKKRYVLKPINGHIACGGASYTVMDGSPSTKDQFQNLDLCSHRLKRVNCRLCGGQFLCKHFGQKHRCKECKAASSKGNSDHT